MIVTKSLIQQVLDSLPTGDAKDWAGAYLPIILRDITEAGIAAVRAAFTLFLNGDKSAARALVLAKMTDAEIEADNQAFTASQAADGSDNAAMVAKLRQAMDAGAQIAISIFLTLVGL